MTIRTMDEATRKALAGLLPIAPGAFIETTLDCFLRLPEDVQPKFHLRDFTAPQFYAMQAALRAGEVPLDLMIKTLQEGVLVGWVNLPNSAFEEIVYSTEAIATLPPRWIDRLYWIAAGLCSPNKLEREVFESGQLPASESSSSPAPAADALPA